MQTFSKLKNRIMKIMMLLSVAVCMLIPSRTALASNVDVQNADAQVVDLTEGETAEGEGAEGETSEAEEEKEPEKILVITVVDDTKKEETQVSTSDSDLKITVIEEESTPLAAMQLVNNEPICIAHYLLILVSAIIVIAGAKSVNAKKAEIRRLKVRLKSARAKGE